MNTPDISIAAIADLLVEQTDCNPDDVTPEAKLAEDLGVDSLAHTELIMAIEEEYNIEIPDESAEVFKTVQDILDYLRERLGTE